MTETKEIITPSPKQKGEFKQTLNPTLTTTNIWVNGHLLKVYNAYISFFVNVKLFPNQQELLVDKLLPSGWSGKYEDVDKDKDKSRLTIIVPFKNKDKKDEKETIRRIALKYNSGETKITWLGSSSEDAIAAVRKFLRVIQKQSKELGIGEWNYVQDTKSKTNTLEPRIVDYKLSSIAGIYRPPIVVTKDATTKDMVSLRLSKMFQDGFQGDPDTKGPPAYRKNIYDPNDASKKLANVGVYKNGIILIIGAPSTAALAKAFEIVQPIIVKYAVEGSIVPFNEKFAEIDSAPDRLEHTEYDEEEKKEETPLLPIEQHRRAAKKQRLDESGKFSSTPVSEDTTEFTFGPRSSSGSGKRKISSASTSGSTLRLNLSSGAGEGAGFGSRSGSGSGSGSRTSSGLKFKSNSKQSAGSIYDRYR